MPKDQLDAQIHAIYDQRPAKLLFIKAGANRIYQDVIEAMDVARGRRRADHRIHAERGRQGAVGYRLSAIGYITG